MAPARPDTLVVVGAQWGDEGKGKIVDLLAESSDVVARFQGGNNAGHTLVVGDERTVLHLVPSGVLHAGTICVIGNGVVIDPAVLLEEVEALRARGLLADPAELRLSEQAHLILPYHKAIDLARERLRGPGKIGTTGRGIGPAYEDKIARTGIRLVDLLEDEVLEPVLRTNIEEKNAYMRAILGESPLRFEEILAECQRTAARLRPYVTDTGRFLEEAIAAGRRVLFEGAQGSMLDVDHGTYPFVTSSNCVAAAAAAGSGVSPGHVRNVLGITKAYTTRVGSGPFPTELDDEIGERLRRDGDEFGATTGRARRCGWFDAVVVRRGARLSGMAGLAITKLDVLTGFDPIRVCVAYEVEGERTEHVPAGRRAFEVARPVYEEHPGWREDLSGARSLDDLPANARTYLDRLAELVGVPIAMVSVGARREQTIVVADPFAQSAAQ